MSKTILAQVDGFTPVIDSMIQEVGAMTALVFGKAWRYCQMSDGICKASQERIADELGVSRQTINSHFSKLCEAGYLKDLTPNLAGLPHRYADTGKANLSINLTATCQNSLQPPVKNFDTKRELKKEVKKQKKEIQGQPDFQNMTVTEAHAVPEFQTFHQATGWFPGSFVWQTVYDAMRSGIDPEKLREAFATWNARGYNPRNVEGYLEWARNGIPPAKQTRQAGKRNDFAANIEALQAWVGAD